MLQAKELKRHYAASKILKCESSSRSMNGNIIEQVIAYVVVFHVVVSKATVADACMRAGVAGAAT